MYWQTGASAGGGIELPHKKCYRKENRKRRFIYMSPQSKEEYFEVFYKRYKEATRKEKTVIITECALSVVIIGNMRSGG
jgi:hypothetical protein